MSSNATHGKEAIGEQTADHTAHQAVLDAYDPDPLPDWDVYSPVVRLTTETVDRVTEVGSDETRTPDDETKPTTDETERVALADGGVVKSVSGDEQMPVSDPPSDLHRLDVKALTTSMTVLDNAPGIDDADDMWLVQNETEHVVAQVGDDFVCDCRGNQFGHTCYHIRRLAFELGERTVPEWVNEDRIDEMFRAFVTPEVSDDD